MDVQTDLNETLDFSHNVKPNVTEAMELASGIIREFEQGPDGGFARKPYLCPGGKYTIGWGHQIRAPIELGFFEPGISEADAERLMWQDLAKAEASLNQLCDAELTTYQRAALISFIFNLGHGKFASSTLLARINAGEIADAPAQLKRWVHTGGQVTQGLVRRREAEIALGAPW